MPTLHTPPNIPQPVEPDFGDPVIPVGDPPQAPIQVSFPEFDTTQLGQPDVVEQVY